MRKACLLILILAMAGCLELTVNDRPAPFLGEDKMAAIVTDIVLLDGMKTSSYRSFQNLNLKPNDYIYRKHDTDSTQLAAHMAYYADHPTEYLELLEVVRANLENRSDQLDSIVKQKAIGESDSDSTTEVNDTLPKSPLLKPPGSLRVQLLDSMRRIRAERMQAADTSS